MPGPFDDLIPSQPTQQPAHQPATPGIIMGRPKPVDPFKVSAEQRAQADQARQDAQFQASQQKAAFDIEKAKRDLAPGADTTEAEKTAAFLATRVAGGVDELKSIYKRNRGAANPKVGTEVVRGLFGETGANYANDADRQQVEAAQLDVLDAALTLGTGAAYTPVQLEGYRRSYFPQLGDAPETIAAKQKRLITMLEAAKVKAGRAAPQIDQALAAVQGDLAADNPTGAPAAEDALRAKFPEATRFLYSKGELVGYEDASGDFVAVVDNQPPPDGPSGGPSVADSLYAGVGDIAQGVGDTLGLVGNPLNAGINAIAGTNLSTDLGQTFRDATGAPQGDPLANAVNRGGTAALTMAGAAGAARPFVTGAAEGVTNALAQQPVRQAVGGMTAGASAETARQNNAPVAVQIGAGLLGGVLGYGGANALATGMEAARATPNALAPQIVAEAKRAKVPLMTTDAVPPRTVVGKTARKMGEVIPIAGTGGARVKQQESRIEAVKQLAREFETDEASLAAVTKDLTAERSKQITAFTGQKEQILANVTAPAAAPRAIAMLDQQIAAASKVQTSGSQALVAKLQDFKKALQNGGNTLRELEAIRKEMGTAFKDPSLANIADAGQKAVRSIYGPLRDDMAATIRKVAGDETAKTWRVANARLAGMADELQSTALKSTLNKASSTPEDVAKLLFSTKPSQVRLLYNNLSAEGRAKAQGVIIAKAMEKAGDSPTKFEGELKRMANNIGVFFQGHDLARINGLQRVLEATKRAGDAGFQPETGAQLTPWVAPAALSALFGAKGGLAAAGGYGLMARVYESAPVRDALLKLGRTKPGSPQERAILPKVSAALIAANENSSLANAPGLSQAAASDQVGEKRPIQP